MNEVVLQVIVPTDGKFCSKACPFLVTMDAVVMMRYNCTLFNTSLLSNKKPYRSDICLKSQEEPRKPYNL